MNIFKLIISIILIAGTIFQPAYGQKTSIEGKIAGLGNDTLIVEYLVRNHLGNNDSTVQENVIAVNDKFIFNLPKQASNSVVFYPKRFQNVEWHRNIPDALKIAIDCNRDSTLYVDGKLASNYIDYTVEGDEFNRDRSLNRRLYLHHLIDAANARIAQDSLQFCPAAKPDSTAENLKIHEEKIQAMREIRHRAEDACNPVKIDYILKNPKKELSSYYMLWLPADTVLKYIDVLGNPLPEGRYKWILGMMVDQHRKDKNKALIKAGAPAPDFTQKTPDGKPLSLYSIEKEYVVIDFWGSWCHWCIKDFPKMKEYYEKYGDRVEFLGVACNDKETDWKRCIAKHSLPWLQVIDDENHSVAVQYAINAYPSAILLDKDKRIIEVFFGSGKNFYNKLDEIFK